MSEEDLFPSWLSRLFQRDLKATRFRKVAKPRIGGRTIGDPEQRINVRLPVVCKNCNTQWMSQIENHVKPVLTRAILKPNEAVTLTDEECAALIIWTTIKSIVADESDSRAIGSPRFFTQQQRTALRDDWMPPDRVEMWIGRCAPEKHQPLRFEFTYSGFRRIPTLRRLHHLHTMTVTIKMLEFIIQALFLRNLEAPKAGALNHVPESAYAIRPKRVSWDHFMVQLHPNVGEVRWPPPAQLDSNGLEALICRISSRTPGV